MVASGLVEPAYEVGGDVFDVALDKDDALVAIFDSVGHDLAAGLISAWPSEAFATAAGPGRVFPAIAAGTALSERVREAVLAGVLADHTGRRTGRSPRSETSRANTALALRALLDEDSSGLSPGEAALLRELLDRLGAS